MKENRENSYLKKLFNRAKNLIENHKFDEAMKISKNIDLKKIETYDLIVDFLLDLSVEFHIKQKLDKTIEILENIDLKKIEIHGIKVTILGFLSNCYINNHKLDKAIEILENIDLSDTKNEYALILVYYSGCIAYMKKNNKEKFNENIRKLLKENKEPKLLVDIILYSDTKIDFIKEIFSKLTKEKEQELLKEIFKYPKAMKYLEDIGNKEILDKFNSLEISKDDFKSTEDNVIFYKYRDINIYTINSLIEKGIYKSDPKNFNDPFDPIFKIDDLNSEILKEKLKDIKIVSLSKNCDNYLMWSHYANSHKGICLGYKINKLGNDIAFRKVEYKNLKCDEIMSMAFDNYNGNLGLTTDDIYLRKYKDWKYEQEYRFICLKNNGKEYLTDEIELKEVIFGYKISESDKRHIKEIIEKFYNKEYIKYKQVKFNSEKFEIEIVDYEE